MIIYEGRCHLAMPIILEGVPLNITGSGITYYVLILSALFYKNHPPICKKNMQLGEKRYVH